MPQRLDILLETFSCHPELRKHIISSLLSALRQLRELGFAHRGIEPSLIFLTEDLNQIRLGWGDNVCYSEESEEDVAEGISIYSCSSGKKIPRGSIMWDMYSIGIIALRLVAGEQLFNKIIANKRFRTNPSLNILKNFLGNYDEVAFIWACLESSH